MLYRRGDTYWTQFEHGGRRYRLSTHCRNRRDAATEASRLRSEIGAQVKSGRPGPCGVTLETLEALDLARVADEGLGEIRRKTVEGLWGPLHRALGERARVDSLTIGGLLEYVGTRRRAGCSGQTIKREVGALVRALKVARRDRLIRELPFDPDDLPRIRHDPPKETRRGKLRSEGQILAVLSNLSAKAITAGHRDRCLLIMLTGLRLEELHRLRPDWVALTLPPCPVPALLHVPAEGAKWGKPRTIPLCAEALDIIRRRAPFRRVKPNKSLALASSNAGFGWVLTPRDLRCWYLTTVGANDPVAAQVLGGHSNIATTGLYLKSTEARAIAASLAATQIGARVATAGWTQSKQKAQCAPVVHLDRTPAF